MGSWPGEIYRFPSPEASGEGLGMRESRRDSSGKHGGDVYPIIAAKEAKNDRSSEANFS